MVTDTTGFAAEQATDPYVLNDDAFVQPSALPYALIPLAYVPAPQSVGVPILAKPPGVPSLLTKLAPSGSCVVPARTTPAPSAYINREPAAINGAL